MSKRTEFVDALVNETATAYENLVSPALLKQMQSALQDSLEAHPVASELVDELMTREQVDESGEQPARGVRKHIEAIKRAKSSG